MKFLRFILVVVAVGYIVYFLETVVKPALLKGRYQLVLDKPLCFKLDTETGTVTRIDWPNWREVALSSKSNLTKPAEKKETIKAKWQEAPIVEQSKDIFDEISSAEKKDSNDPEQKTKRIRFIPDNP